MVVELRFVPFPAPNCRRFPSFSLLAVAHKQKSRVLWRCCFITGDYSPVVAEALDRMLESEGAQLDENDREAQMWRILDREREEAPYNLSNDR